MHTVLNGAQSGGGLWDSITKNEQKSGPSGDLHTHSTTATFTDSVGSCLAHLLFDHQFQLFLFVSALHSNLYTHAYLNNQGFPLHLHTLLYAKSTFCLLWYILALWTIKFGWLRTFFKCVFSRGGADSTISARSRFDSSSFICRLMFGTLRLCPLCCLLSFVGYYPVIAWNNSDKWEANNSAHLLAAINWQAGQIWRRSGHFSVYLCPANCLTESAQGHGQG